MWHQMSSGQMKLWDMSMTAVCIQTVICAVGVDIVVYRAVSWFGTDDFSILPYSLCVIRSELEYVIRICNRIIRNTFRKFIDELFCIIYGTSGTRERNLLDLLCLPMSCCIKHPTFGVAALVTQQHNQTFNLLNHFLLC